MEHIITFQAPPTDPRPRLYAHVWEVRFQDLHDKDGRQVQKCIESQAGKVLLDPWRIDLQTTDESGSWTEIYVTR